MKAFRVLIVVAAAAAAMAFAAPALAKPAPIDPADSMVWQADTSSSTATSSGGVDTGVLAGSIGGALLLAAGVGTAVVHRRRHGRMAIS